MLVEILSKNVKIIQYLIIKECCDGYKFHDN